MKPKEAMEYLIDQGHSKYKIAQVMGMHPIMIDRILKEEVKTIRKEAVTNLHDAFEIVIEDLYINGEKRKTYQSKMWINSKNQLDT